ncbi:MAG: bifunctional DNA primase/polymerase [Patescibacteria group bacterium]
MSELLAHALKYLGKGISVIPVGKNKVPLVQWAEFQTRLATEDEVKSWWTKWPEANIGVITGKLSKIAVIDVEAGGDISKFPSTTIIRTGGGGYHLYYQYIPSTPIENKTRVYPLTDVRGDGGYVVAPPSIHSSGKKYEVLERREMAKFPIELFGGKKEKRDWSEIIKGTNEGSRNANIASIAGKLLTIVAPAEWETSVWPVLISTNAGNKPPLSEYELRNIYRSIAKRELAKRRGSEDVNEIEDELVLTFTDVVKVGMEELDLVDPASVISFGYEFLDNQLTGIFPGNLIIFGGETGTGKTTFATNILVKASVKHKCHIFALEDRLQDYGIKAIYFELGKVRRKQGLKNYPWNDYRKNNIKDPMYVAYREEAVKNLQNSNLTFSDCQEMMDIDLLEKKIEKRILDGVELFLIDHLHTFDLLRGKSSKADYIEQIMVRLIALKKKTGARILLIAHYKKLDGGKPKLDSFKDSAAIPQSADSVVNIWRDRSEGADKNKTTFIIPKTRNPNGEATFEIEFDPDICDYKFISSKSGAGEPAPQEINVETLNFS